MEDASGLGLKAHFEYVGSELDKPLLEVKEIFQKNLETIQNIRHVLYKDCQKGELKGELVKQCHVVLVDRISEDYFKISLRPKSKSAGLKSRKVKSNIRGNG